nr:nucleotide-binding alpha-beta plait domain-containing protein [Tanacetum cinerariifolium]
MFVTNFPDESTAKELFCACSVYGHVVDSYILSKRAKNGKRFGFVRFINVFSEERLANNLCTVWMGRHKLIANISRFQRNNNKCGFGVSIGDSIDKSPAMILDDECLVSSEFSNSLFGRVKEFTSLANIKIALANERFADISIQYLGEYWILVKFSSQDARQLFRDSVSVGSWFLILKEASSDFHCDKRIAWVETEGIPFKLWTKNTFKRIASRWGVFLSVDD